MINEYWQGKPKYLEKTCPSATLSITDPRDLTSDQTQAAAMGNWQLTASALAGPKRIGYYMYHMYSEALHFAKTLCSYDSHSKLQLCL
jgi:hypothetical protein